MSTVSSPTPVGIAWYRAEDYDGIVALMADGRSFPNTHASWRLKIGRMERGLKRQGQQPVRIDIEPAAFAAWCEKRQVAADSLARTTFVDEGLRRRMSRLAGTDESAPPP